MGDNLRYTPARMMLAALAASVLLVGCVETTGDGDDDQPVAAPDPCAGLPFPALTTVPDSTIVVTTVDNADLIDPDQVPPFEALAQIDDAAYLRFSASSGDVVPALGFEPVIVEPEYLYQGSPIRRGHPVDNPEPPSTDQSPFEASPEPTSSAVAVIDAVPDDQWVLTQHGPFIVNVIEQKGSTAKLFGAPPIKFETTLEFAEGELIVAVADVHADIAAGSSFDAINLSLGTYGCPGGPEPGRALHDALTRLKVDVVASAGNDGVDQPTFPAAKFIGVGSINQSGERSCFSNFGPWVDHWVVGEEVAGLLPKSEVEAWDGGAVTWSGTSFAAPQAAASELAGQDLSANGGDRTPGEVAKDDAAYGCPNP